MRNLRKCIFIGVTVLLFVSFAFNGSLWHTLSVTKGLLAVTEAQLANSLTELDATKTQLTDTQAVLGTTRVKLADTEVQLGTTKIQLADTEARLNITKAQLTKTEEQLTSTNVALSATKAQLETAKNEQTRILNQYNNIRKQINVRSGNGVDSQTFITPNDPSVSSRTLEVAGGHPRDVTEVWRGYERLYWWVVNNIKYSYDSYLPVIPDISGGDLSWEKDFWRKPSETLQDKTGDCEDMATLLASMSLNYNEGKFGIWLLGIRSTSPEVGGHIAVAFPVAGGNLTILDPAGNYYSGQQYGSLYSDKIAIEVNRWLSHWSKEMPNAEVNSVFSDKLYNRFSSTAEFIKWASEQ